MTVQNHTQTHTHTLDGLCSTLSGNIHGGTESGMQISIDSSGRKYFGPMILRRFNCFFYCRYQLARKMMMFFLAW
jgi:hypothetical protein